MTNLYFADATYGPTGTAIQTGELPIKFDANGGIDIPGKKKEIREFNGRQYLLEEAL